MFLFLRPQLFSGNHVRQEAARVYIRKQDHLFRTEDGGCFCHEPDSAKNDYTGTGFGSILAQFQRIANEVGYILNLAQLIVMGKDNSISFFLKGQDFLYYFSIPVPHPWLSSSNKNHYVNLVSVFHRCS